MAETCHLYLKLAGTDIQGESTQTSNGRENSIECLYFEHAVKTVREAGSGMATGRRQYDPMIIRKRIDKSTPLLAKGLAENTKADGIIKFFRPNPGGDGTTQHFYTVAFTNGRLASFKQVSPDRFEDGGARQTYPELEEIAFVFHTIKWRYEVGGIEHEDTWDQNR